MQLFSCTAHDFDLRIDILFSDLNKCLRDNHSQSALICYGRILELIELGRESTCYDAEVATYLRCKLIDLMKSHHFNF